VPNQRLPVLGDGDVQFQCADTEFNGFAEGPQRFLGRFTTAAAMGLQVKVARLAEAGEASSTASVSSAAARRAGN